MFDNESREKTFLFIQTKIYEATNLIETYLKNNKTNDPLLIKSIITNLNKSKIGIKNLQFTYDDDRITVCKLGTLIIYIDSFFTKMLQDYKHMFEKIIFILMNIIIVIIHQLHTLFILILTIFLIIIKIILIKC